MVQTGCLESTDTMGTNIFHLSREGKHLEINVFENSSKTAVNFPKYIRLVPKQLKMKQSRAIDHMRIAVSCNRNSVRTESL